jgi:hypothetical protein
MKKMLVVAILFVIFAVIGPAYADSVDGLWAFSASDTVYFVMVRANGGTLLATVLGGFSNDRLNWWQPYFGTFNGTTGNLSLIVTSQSNGNLFQSADLTFDLTSPTTAILIVTNCTNFPNQNNCPPIGTIFSLAKIY